MCCMLSYEPMFAAGSLPMELSFRYLCVICLDGSDFFNCWELLLHPEMACDSWGWYMALYLLWCWDLPGPLVFCIVFILLGKRCWFWSMNSCNCCFRLDSCTCRFTLESPVSNGEAAFMSICFWSLCFELLVPSSASFAGVLLLLLSSMLRSLDWEYAIDLFCEERTEAIFYNSRSSNFSWMRSWIGDIIGELGLLIKGKN